MTDPGLEPLSGRALELLEEERPIPPLAPELAANLRERVWQTIGIVGPGGGGDGGGSGGAPGAESSAPAATAGAAQSIAPSAAVAVSAKAVAIAAFAVGAVVGGGTVGAVMSAQQSPPVHASASPVIPRVVLAIPAATSQPDLAREPNSEPTPSASAAKTVGPPASSITATGRDADLGAERALLAIARTAVGRGDGQAALVALRQHQQRFPQGRLNEERESLRVQALMLAGDPDAAKRQADSFKQRYPESMLGRAVDKALEKKDGAK